MSETSATTQVLKPGKKHLGVIGSILAGITIYLLPQFVAGFSIALWAGVSGADIDSFYDNNTILINFIFSISSAIVGFILVYLLTRGYGGLSGIGMKMVSLRKTLLFIPAYIVYFAVLIGAFTLIEKLNIGINLDQEQVVGFEGAADTLQLVFAFISLVILAPLIEEILFRGILFTNISRKTGFWPAAILISGLFGLAHMQLNVGIDTFLLGMAASWLVWTTKSIYPAILLHMLKNSVAFVILFIVN